MQTLRSGAAAPLSREIKLGYGVAGFGDSALYGIYVSFYLFFLTDVALVPAALAGALMTLGVVWDAFTDPLVGMISDNSRSRFGRRRPYMLVNAVPLGLASWLIFTDPGLGGGWTGAYYLVMLLLYFTAYTLFYVPWTAFGAEITTDYDQRSSLMSYKMGYAALGAVLGGAVPLLLVQHFSVSLGSEKRGWSAMAASIGAVATFSVLVSWRTTRGAEPVPAPGGGRRVSWTEHLVEIPEIFRCNRPFRYVIGLFSFGVMAEALSAAFLVYYGVYFMGLSEAQISLVLLVATGTGFLWLPAVNLTAQRLGKRHAYALFVGAWVLGYVLTFACVTPERFALLCALRALASSGWFAMWALGWAMIGDVTDVDELHSGRRREGLYYGVVQFVQKCAVGLVSLAGGLILTGVGYVPDVPQTPAALLGIQVTYCLGVALLLVLAIALALRYPVTRARHAQLRDAIERRSRGEDIDTARIAQLFD